MGMTFYAKDFSSSNLSRNGALNKIGPAATKNLTYRQKGVLLKKLEKYKNSKNALGKALADVVYDKGDGITSSIASGISKATGTKIDYSGYYSSIQNKSKFDANKSTAKKITPNGNPARQLFSTADRLSQMRPSISPSPPRLGQPGAAMTTAQFYQQFFKRGGSNLRMAGVAGTRH